MAAVFKKLCHRLCVLLQLTPFHFSGAKLHHLDISGQVSCVCVCVWKVSSWVVTTLQGDMGVAKRGDRHTFQVYSKLYSAGIRKLHVSQC